MNRLAVFDVDGTLTDTNDVDDECFVVALKDVLGLSVDWSDAPHITDSGILEWAYTARYGKSISKPQAMAVQKRFAELVKRCIDEDSSRFRSIPGSTQIFDELRAAGWAIALATGGWSATARLKLDNAGIDTSNIPLASANDGETRIGIVEVAIQRAQRHYSVDFDRVVSIGDARWDYLTAVAMKIPFVGVTSRLSAVEFESWGATTTVRDYTDANAVINALENAEVPAMLYIRE